MSDKLRQPLIKKPSKGQTQPAKHDDEQPQLSGQQSSSDPQHGDVLRLQRLIGNHRVTQLLGQSPTPAVQREGEGTVNMPATNVSGDRGGTVENNVSNLGRLAGVGVDPSQPQIVRVDQNAPNPTERLPYTAGGWDGNTILTRLGQFDQLAGTDSDASRCVQAVAMASHIPGGPASLTGYLSAITIDGMLMSQNGQDRQRTALQVIRLVKERVTAGTATYGDLSWAQEAIHDLFYTDVVGTPEDQIVQQISPMLDGLSRNTTTMNVWCSTPAEVMAQAQTLPAGGQLIVNSWMVVFNSAFDQVEEQGFQTQNRMRVNVNGRMQWIRRIPTNVRPSPQDIHFPSDSKSGHQLLVMKDNTTEGTLRLYEPEITNSGQHLQALSASGAELQTYLHDDTQNGIYGYIQITGKVLPQTAAASPFAAP